MRPGRSNGMVDTRRFRADTSVAESVKTLFITVIALVIPAFFLFIMVMGTYGRLSALRRRCQQLATPGEAAAQRGERPDDKAYAEAVARYDAARTTFPASLISRLFGFGPVADSTRAGSPKDFHR